MILKLEGVIGIAGFPCLCGQRQAYFAIRPVSKQEVKLSFLFWYCTLCKACSHLQLHNINISVSADVRHSQGAIFLTNVSGFSHYLANDILFEMQAYMVQCAISPVSYQGLGIERLIVAIIFRSIPKIDCSINGPTCKAKRQCAKD